MLKRLIVALIVLAGLAYGQGSVHPRQLRQAGATTNQCLVWDGAVWGPGSCGAGGGAPTTATYVTQTPDGTLTAEQALSLLATGILKSTTATGVISIAVGADLPAHASRHQHAGNDEVATGTAAANAIPKADAGGKIAVAWLAEVLGAADLTTYASVSGTGTAAIASTITLPASTHALFWTGTDWANRQPAFTDLTGTIALAQTVLTTRGDLLTVNSSPALARLAVGAAKKVLTSDGTDPLYQFARVRSHATDCTSLTDGNEGEVCYEQDSDEAYVCEPTAGACDTVAEWRQLGIGSGIVTTGAVNDIPCYTASVTLGPCNTGNFTFNAGLLRITNTGSNKIHFGTNGLGAPGAGSLGQKIQLFGTPGSVGADDFGIGMEADFMWLGAGSSGGFKFYGQSGGNVLLATIQRLVGNVGSIEVNAVGVFKWTGRSQIFSAADGDLTLETATGGAFGRINFGGTTTSFPALKRSTTTLQARLADDSAFTGFAASNITLSNNTNQIVLGTTNTTTVTMAALAASRTFTLPDANSNPIQPLTCTGSDKVSAISAAGVITCTADVSGGSPAWEGLVNSADSATAYTSNNVAETVTFSFESAFGASQQFLIRQQTGNPTAGTLLDVRAADTNVTVFRAGDGTNGITVSQAGALTAEGTGSITATILALASNPANCTGNNFALGIGTTGAAECAQPAFSNLSGGIALAQTPLTTRGDLLTVDAVPALVRLAIGAAKKVLTSDGSDPLYQFARVRSHATDCTGLTDGNEGEVCYEQDADTVYVCEPTAGACDTAAEWRQVSGAGGAPTGAQYLVLALDGTLTAERRFVDGAGILATDGGANGDYTLATASSETDFLAVGALTCGAGTRGKMQVHTTPLQYCDNAATPALQYAAYADSTGNALTGDTATAFFSAGQIEAARGGTGDDTSATTGVPRIASGNWTYDAGISHLAASSSADLRGVLSDETGGAGLTVFNINPTLTDVTIDDVAFFTETAGDATCAAGDYWIKGNSTTNRLRGCENGTAFNINQAAASAAWETLTNSADTATTYLSNTTTETVDFQFQAAFTTGTQFGIRQNTGNPTGGTLFEVRAADGDVMAMRVGDGTNGLTVTQAGATKIDEATLTQEDDGIGVTSTDGIIIQNTTAAAAGAQQWSPRVHFIGQGWKTDATAASQTADMIVELQTIQDNATPRADLIFSSQINGAGYLRRFSIHDLGGIVVGSGPVEVNDGPQIQLVGGDGFNAIMKIFAHGSAATPTYNSFRARGTKAAPSAALANDDFMFLGGRGYGTTAFPTSSRAAIRFRAAENQTDSAQGSYIGFETTGIGTTTRREVARIFDSGGFNLGDVDDPGQNNFKLKNAATIGWEASPAGTDITLTVDSSEVFQFSSIVNVTTGFRIGGAAAANNVLAGDGTNFVSTATSGGGAPVGASRAINTSSPYLTGGGDLSANRTLTLAYTATQAGDPALNAEECVFTTDGSGGGILCEGTTADTNEGLIQWNPTTDKVLTLPDATDTLVGKATTDTLTNKTLDAEGAGNTVTTVGYVEYTGASCQGTSSALGFNNPTTNAPAANCVTGTNTIHGVADFDAATDESVQGNFTLPSDWTGNIDIDLYWYAAATTGDVIWGLQTICVATGETLDPAFNTAQTVTDTVQGTTNQLNIASITTVTVTGCAAGERFFFKLYRDADNASDTMSGDARLVSARWKIRRAQ